MPSHWSGHGAAALLEHDDADRALLLERIEPGTPLWRSRTTRGRPRSVQMVLRSRSTEPISTDSARSRRRQHTGPRRSLPTGERRRAYPAALVEVAVDACATLPAADAARVVLHQDFHGGNVLQRERGWLAIDPKPLVGDPAFDAASLLRDRRWLLGPRRRSEGSAAARRPGRLAELDRERMRLWGIVHALAWGVGGKSSCEGDMVRCAELLRGA